MVKHSEIFKQFYGTEHYYLVSKYAYTDGINYLKEKLNNDELFFKFFNNISDLLSYRYPFLSIELRINNDNFDYLITDENDHKIVMYSDYINNNEDNKLNGTYKIFMYNYVMLAASEY